MAKNKKHEITSEQLEHFLGSDHTNKDDLLDEIISILNKNVDVDDYVQDVIDYWRGTTDTIVEKVKSYGKK